MSYREIQAKIMNREYAGLGPAYTAIDLEYQSGAINYVEADVLKALASLVYE